MWAIVAVYLLRKGRRVVCRSRTVGGGGSVILSLSSARTATGVYGTLSSRAQLRVLGYLISGSVAVDRLTRTFCLPVSSVYLRVGALDRTGLVAIIPGPKLHNSRGLYNVGATGMALSVFTRLGGLAHGPPICIGVPVNRCDSYRVLPPYKVTSTTSCMCCRSDPCNFCSPSHASTTLV